VAGFAAHTLDMGQVTSQPGNSLLDGTFHLSFFAWVLVGCWFLAWMRLKLGFLALTVSPLALFFYIASLAAGQLKVVMPKVLVMPFFALHIASLFIALALLAVASGAGIAFLWIEGRIKSKERLRGFEADMPSLATFDRANHLAVVAGFPLYTLGLATGFLWARMTWGRVFTWDPKEVAAILLWLAFAYLFHQRVMLGWLGRKPAVLAIWLFFLAVLSMLGVNFFLPTHHGFTRMPA
jgi:ABC-type transport system involved in cytochrome c biogenesis permease subunit